MVLYDLPASYDGGFGWKPTTIFGVSTNNIFYCQYWQNAAVAREACLWLLKVGQKRRCEFERIFCFKYISKTWSACASWSYKCGCLKCVACHHKTCRDAEETVFVLWRCRDSHWVSLFFSKSWVNSSIAGSYSNLYFVRTNSTRYVLSRECVSNYYS